MKLGEGGKLEKPPEKRTQTPFRTPRYFRLHVKITCLKSKYFYSFSLSLTTNIIIVVFWTPFNAITNVHISFKLIIKLQ